MCRTYLRDRKSCRGDRLVEKEGVAVQGPDSERHSISDRNEHTGALSIAPIHGYLLGLKSIKTLIVGLQKI